MAWVKANPTDDGLLINAPTQLRANWTALELGTDSALQITDAKCAADMGLVDTKLATISTAGKVLGAALNTLSGIPSGAGLIPIANIPTITTAKGGTNLTSYTQGDVLYASAANTLAALAKGTALQMLRMNAGATAPEWSDPVNTQGVVKGWVSFDGSGGSVSINDSYNVSDVTYLSAGTYRVTWDVDFAGTNYACIASSAAYATVRNANIAAGTVEVRSADSGGNFTDTSRMNVMAIGDQ